MEKVIGFNLQLTEEQYDYLVKLELRELDELGVLRMIIGMYKEEEKNGN
ncbi:MAG: hypothetical protein ACRCXX_13575 [Cetobacterium sp.]